MVKKVTTKTRTELVFIGTKLALEVKYPRQRGGFQPAFIHIIESPTASETSNKMVFKFASSRTKKIHLSQRIR